MAPTGVPIFDIEELLEQILLSVSQIDLIVLQRVSHTFSSTISGSRLLQATLSEAVVFEKENRGYEPGEDDEFGVFHIIEPRTHTYVSTLLHYTSFLQFPPFEAHKTGEGRTDAGIPTLYVDFSSFKSGEELGWRGKSGTVYSSGRWERFALGTSAGRVDVREHEKDDYCDTEGGLECGTGMPDDAWDYKGPLATIPSGASLRDVFRAVREMRDEIEERDVSAADQRALYADDW